MSNSILTSTKKVLGIEASYEAFDLDIIMHINTALATLTQLGIGPAEGMTIVDASTEWDTFLGGDPRLNAARTYVYLKVRSIFDPPGTSYLVEAMKEQLREMEWRLTTQRDEINAPITTAIVIDGGAP